MSLDDFVARMESSAAAPPRRRLVLTPASAIVMRPVEWLWEQRIPKGMFFIPAGREGTGKSQFLVWLCAQVTRGTLPGCYFGEPRAVFYCATEDSWSHTIAPRLEAAGADRTKVFRIEVKIYEDDNMTLSLPADNGELEDAIVEYGAAFVALDPLLSFLHGTLDSHKAASVRLALDPLGAIVDRTEAAVAGLMHFNKSTATDVSSAIGGSHAFKDVARAVFGFAHDETADLRVMTQSKNSVGRTLPSLSYELESFSVPLPGGQFSDVSRLVWTGESERSVGDLLRDAHGSPDEREAREEAADWLRSFLAELPGHSAPASEIRVAAEKAGINWRTLQRARPRAKVATERHGFGGGAVWSFTPFVTFMTSQETSPSESRMSRMDDRDVTNADTNETFGTNGGGPENDFDDKWLGSF